MNLVKPNFFVVGAPKSGTSTLYEFLRRHPAIFMPSRKEPHHFAPDLYAPRYLRDQTVYLALFQPGRQKTRVGEASVYYLYSRESAQAIRRFAPDGKIIVMLRNPIDMVYSLHSQRVYSGYEDIEDFEEALAAEDDRRDGKRLPEFGHPFPCLLYREVGKYAAQFERYLDAFPREQIHVILFDDLAQDAYSVLRGVCHFLGVADQCEPNLRIQNPNTSIRSTRLRTLMKFTPWTKGVARAVLPKSARGAVAVGLRRLNTRIGPRPPLRPEVRQMLIKEFRSDVAQLSRLVGRDLGHWVAHVKP